MRFFDTLDKKLLALLRKVLIKAFFCHGNKGFLLILSSLTQSAQPGIQLAFTSRVQMPLLKGPILGPTTDKGHWKRKHRRKDHRMNQRRHGQSRENHQLVNRAVVSALVGNRNKLDR